MNPISRSALLPGLLLVFAVACHRVDLAVPRITQKTDPDRAAAVWQHKEPEVRAAFTVVADTLLVEFRSSSPALARSLRQGGLTFWLDEAGGKAQHFGLQFRGPLGAMERGGERAGHERDLPARRPRPDTPSAVPGLENPLTPPGNPEGVPIRREPTFIDELNVPEQIHCLREPGENTVLLPRTSPLEGCQHFSRQGRDWLLRLALPLGVPLDGSRGVTLHPGTVIGLGLVEQKQERLQRTGPPRSGGARPGGRAGGPGGGSGGGPGGSGGSPGGMGGGGRPGGGMGGHGPGGPGGASGGDDPLKVWFRLELPTS